MGSFAGLDKLTNQILACVGRHHRRLTCVGQTLQCDV